MSSLGSLLTLTMHVCIWSTTISVIESFWRKAWAGVWSLLATSSSKVDISWENLRVPRRGVYFRFVRILWKLWCVAPVCLSRWSCSEKSHTWSEFLQARKTTGKRVENLAIIGPSKLIFLGMDSCYSGMKPRGKYWGSWLWPCDWREMSENSIFFERLTCSLIYWLTCTQAISMSSGNNLSTSSLKGSSFLWARTLYAGYCFCPKNVDYWIPCIECLKILCLDSWSLGWPVVLSCSSWIWSNLLFLPSPCFELCICVRFIFCWEPLCSREFLCLNLGSLLTPAFRGTSFVLVW